MEREQTTIRLPVELKEKLQEEEDSYSDKLKYTLEHIGKSRGHNSNIMVEEIKRDKKGATYKITNCNPMNYMDLPKPYIFESYYEDCVIDKLYKMLISIL